MSTRLPLRCSCGTVRGTASNVSPKTVTRLICYCDDCQTFAHHLGVEDQVLDEHGGTDICQLSPANIAFTEGEDNIASLKQSLKGATRWYTTCCNTPIGNTMSTASMPFVGLIHAFIDHESNGRSADESIGPVLARVHERFAIGHAASNAARSKIQPGIMFRVGRRLIWWKLRGDAKRSPFFEDGKPIREPTMLTKDERNALRQNVTALRA